MKNKLSSVKRRDHATQIIHDMVQRKMDSFFSDIIYDFSPIRELIEDDIEPDQLTSLILAILHEGVDNLFEAISVELQYQGFGEKAQPHSENLTSTERNLEASQF